MSKILLSKTTLLEKSWFDYDLLMECVKSDKKNDGNINLVLIKNSEPVLQRIEDCSIIRMAINDVYESIGLHNSVLV